MLGAGRSEMAEEKRGRAREGCQERDAQKEPWRRLQSRTQGIGHGALTKWSPFGFTPRSYRPHPAVNSSLLVTYKPCAVHLTQRRAGYVKLHPTLNRPVSLFTHTQRGTHAFSAPHKKGIESATSHMSDKIVKLVFLRSGESRKAVVPLVEGCDFEQFLQRVRRRLGVPEDIKPTLSDAATGTVDSIDRLLEVDEGNTLDVHLHTAGGLPYVPPPAAALPTPTPPPPQPPGNGAAARPCAPARTAHRARTRGRRDHRLARLTLPAIQAVPSRRSSRARAASSASRLATVRMTVSPSTIGGGRAAS